MMTDEVVIINRKNYLKEKVLAQSPGHNGGKGTIDPEAIKRAKNVLQTSHNSFRNELSENLAKLKKLWKSIQNINAYTEDSDERKEFHRLSNHIGDIAATFDYDLMSYFGKSLRDFNTALDINNDKHKIIIKAHLDVMTITYDQDIKDADSLAAKELVKMVSQAIKKHS